MNEVKDFLVGRRARAPLHVAEYVHNFRDHEIAIVGATCTESVLDVQWLSLDDSCKLRTESLLFHAYLTTWHFALYC